MTTPTQLPDKPLTIVAGAARTGAPITHAVAAGWTNALIKAGKRVSVVGADLQAFGYWLQLSGWSGNGSEHERTALHSVDPKIFTTRDGAALAALVAQSVKWNEPDLTIVIDHHDVDEASWSWLRTVSTPVSYTHLTLPTICSV